MKYLALFLALAPAAVSAADLSHSFTIGAQSDYLWRGISQNNHKFGAFASADLNYDIYYAGTSFETVDFKDAINKNVKNELDFYMGVRPTIGPFTFEAAINSYNYPNHAKANFVEAKAGALWTASNGISTGANFYYSPKKYDYTNKNGSNLYSELYIGKPLLQKLGDFSLNTTLAYGVNNPEKSKSYQIIRASLAANNSKNLGLEIGASSTDLTKIYITDSLSQRVKADSEKSGRSAAYITIKKTF